jgi:hypothetical protein
VSSQVEEKQQKPTKLQRLISTMKHSQKEKRPKGCSKGKSDDHIAFRRGPIMIDEIMREEPSYSKSDASVREMMIRTDPQDDASPVIKRRFKPLDNPPTMLELIKGIQVIKEGVAGNNVTTGPNQHNCWRGCLTGAALAKFNMCATQVGNETVPNLAQVERRLTGCFAPREVPRQQGRCMRLHMRKPKNTPTRQHIGAVSTLNETLTKLPPNFNARQKIPDTDIMDIMALKAPSSHKELMTDHGFDPQMATLEELVEICERQETKEAIRKRPVYTSDSDSSVEAPRHKKKKYQKNPKPDKRQDFCCKEHGPNPTHDTIDCKVLNGRKKKDWKDKDKSETKYSDYRSKCRKKHAELNLLQAQAKKEKAKWKKAYANMKAKEAS